MPEHQRWRENTGHDVDPIMFSRPWQPKLPQRAAGAAEA